MIVLQRELKISAKEMGPDDDESKETILSPLGRRREKS
jgi:hypothetical protein